MFLLAVFLMLIFSVFWRIIIINFFHCCLWTVRNYVKQPKIQYGNKEIQHGLQHQQWCFNSSEIRPLYYRPIIEIYVDLHSKS